MNETIYAPPEAEVVVTRDDLDGFYVVSQRKFLLLAIVTFGYFLTDFRFF